VVIAEKEWFFPFLGAHRFEFGVSIGDSKKKHTEFRFRELVELKNLEK